MLELVRRPLYFFSFFLMPLFIFLFLSNMMEDGLPVKVPAAIVDKDGSSLSREISQTLATMQMIDCVATPESYTEARHMMQEGKIFGYFLIPDNYEADLLAGRAPEISFYTNMTYYVPASLLFKTFKATAIYTKAGIAVNIINSAGVNDNPSPLLMPVNINARGIGNPELNYAIYLCNSFLPCVLQLMIMLVTCFSLGQEIKYGTSVRLMQLARGNIYRAIAAKLLPQTIVWMVMAIFMESWLFGWMHFPLNG